MLHSRRPPYPEWRAYSESGIDFILLSFGSSRSEDNSSVVLLNTLKFVRINQHQEQHQRDAEITTREPGLAVNDRKGACPVPATLEAGSFSF